MKDNIKNNLPTMTVWVHIFYILLYEVDTVIGLTLDKKKNNLTS